MSNLTIDSVDAVYRCAVDYRVYRHRIRYDEFGKFCIEFNLFKQQLGELGEDNYWSKLMARLGRLRFDLCAAPYFNEYRDTKIQETYTELFYYLRSCESIYPDFSKPALHLIDLLKALSGDNKNPLLEKLISLSTSKRRVVWVVKEARLVPQISQLIQYYDDIADCVEALYPAQLSDAICFDSVIAIGSPNWFPDRTFTSPRANEIHIVQYDWVRDSWKLPRAFVSQYKTPRSRDITFVDDQPLETQPILEANSLLPVLDLYALVSYPRSGTHTEYDEIDARCAVLEGGKVIFLDEDDSHKILTIDIDEDGDDRVKNISVSDLREGTFILVRTGGGGDYIVPLADQIMGKDAQFARDCQIRWKQLLRQAVIANGLTKTAIDLLDYGSNIASEINVRNWIFPRNIKTRDFTDFLAIMRLIGLEAKATEYWNVMESINTAHRKAGHRLRNILLEQVGMLNPAILMREGKMEFKISEDEDASLTAFRVQEVLPDVYRIPYSYLGAPLDLEN